MSRKQLNYFFFSSRTTHHHGKKKKKKKKGLFAQTENWKTWKSLCQQSEFFNDRSNNRKPTVRSPIALRQFYFWSPFIVFGSSLHGMTKVALQVSLNCWSQHPLEGPAVICGIALEAQPPQPANRSVSSSPLRIPRSCQMDLPSPCLCQLVLFAS